MARYDMIETEQRLIQPLLPNNLRGRSCERPGGARRPACEAYNRFNR